MIPLAPPYRIARPEDARQLADLVNLAGDGLPEHIWTGMAEPGQDPWDIGRARQAAAAADGKIIVADEGDGAVAGLTGYVIGPDPEPVTDDMPALFRPLIELENLAPNSWYVNVLAVYPNHQNKGYGAELLGIAEQIAQSHGLSRMSLIVDEKNTSAQRLYTRHEYIETARRQFDPGSWQTTSREWILMTKQI